MLVLGLCGAISGCSPVTSSASGSGATSAPAAKTSAASPVTPSSGAPSSGTPSGTPSPAGSTAANAVPVDADGRPFVLWDCERKPKVEPADFVLACVDGSYGLADAHWTKWAPADAVGVGTEYLNDCTPNCAIGHFHNYPVDIRLTGSDLVARNGPFAYTKLTMAYPAKRPPFTTLVKGKRVVTYPGTFSVQLWSGRPIGPKYPVGSTHTATTEIALREPGSRRALSYP